MIQKYVEVVNCSIRRIDFPVKNPMNWSQLKKTWVMFQVCLLTFSVYFGSAVYTAGIPDVAQKFHVSSVASTLGLTCFLLGAGTGWSFLCSDSLPPSLISNSLDRAYALVANERDALHRANAHLLADTVPIHCPSDSYSPGDKLRHAPRLPLHYRLRRLTSPCNGRCNRGRHV
jgi:hypothetical protein